MESLIRVKTEFEKQNDTYSGRKHENCARLNCSLSFKNAIYNTFHECNHTINFDYIRCTDNINVYFMIMFTFKDDLFGIKNTDLIFII